VIYFDTVIKKNREHLREFFMRRKNQTIIDANLCDGCGSCVSVCPSDAIAVIDNVAQIVKDESLGCDHCAAVCPQGAISVGFVDDDALSLSTVEVSDDYISHGDYDTARLVNLMRSRRSCRNYTDKPVSKEVLEDLVKIGTMAPSGTNSQEWTFTIIPDRKSVMAFGAAVADFFRKLNKKAESRILRGVSKVFLKDILGIYYREYYQSVKDALEEWENGGRERLFQGAPAVILVGANKQASCPAEDALLATQNILLAAHAMGLGTCLIGFVVEAIKNDPSLKKIIKIPKDEKVYAVISIGYPDENYLKTTRRKKITPRYFEL
jgi:nitroreductase/NAD-dependent dihydropyrimidine dehydrogenase PreA subunit